MEPIIEPIDRDLIASELTPGHKIRETKKMGNEIYIFHALECPATMREVGRLRELSFREAGGGTGRQIDIDGEDTAPDGYRQLIVWDPEARQIVGGYRYIVSTGSNTPHLSTEHYFRFTDKFRREFLPWTIELGRSFIQPRYQARNNNKSIFALDNVWDGLGALIILNPGVRYLFGKVTMYTDYQKDARNMLIYFMQRYFPDRDHLVDPIDPIDLRIDPAHFDRIFTGATYEENYRILTQQIRDMNENIPPLINSYINLSSTMRVFGTVKNPDFGNVEETGILVTISDIYPHKSERHIKW